MDNIKEKNFIVTSLYVIGASILIISVVAIARVMTREDDIAVDKVLVTDIGDNNTYDEYDVSPVVDLTNDKIMHPYRGETVQLTKDYYDNKSSEDAQVNSLINYKNTYMKNTGILYTSSDSFEVVAVLDGNVTSITKDDILGNVVEIQHTNELITIYHCLGEVLVSVGDAVSQDDVIGNSGSVNIDKGYSNALLFEVDYKGGIMNPNEFYNMNVKDLMG